MESRQTNPGKNEINQIIASLYQTTENQLLTWGTLSGKQKLKRLIRKNVLRQAVAPVDHWFWPQAMLAEGMMCAWGRENTTSWHSNQTFVLESYYDSWINAGQKIYYVDNASHGMPLLDLYEKTGKESYLKAAAKLADYLKKYPRDSKGNLAYRLKDANHIYADALGMICPFLVRYGAMAEEKEFIQLGVTQLLNFLENGMDKKTGLPYHGYDSKTGVKQGCIGWGRAVGWLMMGLSGALCSLPESHPEYDELRAAMRQLEETAALYQRADGGLSWLLPAVEGPEDTSATAMIAGAVLEWKSYESQNSEPQIHASNISVMGGQYHRFDDEKTVGINMDAAVQFLISHIKDGKVGNASGECEGFAQYPQRYGCYPWGNGPALKVLGLIKGQVNE